MSKTTKMTKKNTTLDFENNEDSSSDSDFVENDTIVKPNKISLEKSKSKSVEKSKSKSIQPIQSDEDIRITRNDEPKLKSKSKKPYVMTEARKSAFEKAKAVREENIKINKELKEKEKQSIQQLKDEAK